MYRFIILFLLSIVISDIIGQENKTYLIVSTIDKGDYFFIPESALTDSVIGIIYQDKISAKSTKKNQQIELYWNSSCTIGSYELIITPEQIFFTEGHDNPNSNRLYWVLNIKQSQYNDIRTGITKQDPVGFENMSKYYNNNIYVYYDSVFKDSYPTPESWTDSLKNDLEQYCKKQTSQQLSKFIALLNGYILTESGKIVLPKIEDLFLKFPKYFAYSEQFLNDWLPINIKIIRK